MRKRTKIAVRRGVKRVAVWVACPVVFFLVVRLVWGWEAGRRLEGVKRELRAQGIRYEPVTLARPEGSNPAEILLKTSSSIKLTNDEYVLISEGDNPTVGELEWTGPHKVQVKAIIDKYRGVFDVVDSISQLQEPAIFPRVVVNLGSIRTMAWLLKADAVLLHEEHEDTLALHRINQILAVSRISDGNHTLIGHLVAVAVRAMASNLVEQIRPVQFDAEGHTLRESQLVMRNLLDLEPMKAAQILAVESGCEHVVEYIERDAAEFTPWWIHPLQQDLILYNLRVYERYVPVARADNWQLAHSRFLSIFSAVRPPHSMLEQVTEKYLEYIWDRFTLMHFRSATDSVAAAMFLSSELYKQVHGEYPKVASDLEAILPGGVPVDPFSADGQPMHYRLDADGPTVWSVSENGTDDGAVVKFLPSGSKLQRYGEPPTYQPDVVYGAAWRSASPLSPTSGPRPGAK